MRCLPLILALIPGPSLAQATEPQFALRAGDVPLDRERFATEIVGQTLTFYDDGQSKFSAGGSYSYTYSPRNGGGTQYGTFTLLPEGIICIVYRNGFDRCDMYVRSGERLVVLTEDGERYPVRPGQ